MSDVRVIFVGDSLVAGVGDPEGVGWVGRVVAAAFAAGMPVTAYNLGVRRDTSVDVLARWQAEAEPRAPDDADCGVVFSFGANDATWENGRSRVKPAESMENLSRAIAGAQRKGLPVLVVGPPPINDHAQQERIELLSGGLREVATRHEVPYVDLITPLRPSPLWRDQLEAGDGAHPGSDGYALMAHLIMPTWFPWLSAAARDTTASESDRIRR